MTQVENIVWRLDNVNGQKFEYENLAITVSSKTLTFMLNSKSYSRECFIHREKDSIGKQNKGQLYFDSPVQSENTFGQSEFISYELNLIYLLMDSDTKVLNYYATQKVLQICLYDRVYEFYPSVKAKL